MWKRNCLLLISASAVAAGAFFWYNLGGIRQSAPIDVKLSQQVDKATVKLEDTKRPTSAEALPIRIEVPNADIDAKKKSSAEYRAADLQAVDIGRSDLAKAVAFLRSHYTGTSLQLAISRLVYNLSATDLKYFAEGLKYIGDTQSRNMAIGRIVTEWAGKDPAALARYASESLTGETRSIAMAASAKQFNKWNQFQESAEIVSAMPISMARTRVVEDTCIPWAKIDRTAALAWARSLSGPDDSIAALRQIWIAGNFSNEELAAFANSASDPKEKQIPLGIISDRLIAQDVSMARDWIERLPFPQRADMQGKLAIRVAATDLQAGTQYALQIENPALRNQAIDQVNQMLTSRDPASTIQWIPSLPAELQERAIGLLASQWYTADSEKAVAWIESLPAGNLRDRALITLAGRARLSDPELAQNAAAQITNPKLKEAALRSGR